MKMKKLVKTSLLTSALVLAEVAVIRCGIPFVHGVIHVGLLAYFVRKFIQR